MDLHKLRYTETHEWVDLNGKTARVGITDHAQKEISDVVFIELPKAGRALKAKESAMVVESVKAAFDIYAPVAGKVTRVNEDLRSKPELVNQSPYEKGWLFELEVDDPAQAQGLLTLEQYDGVKDKVGH
ncbi:MAG: Glycine cleavage system H protein [Candidatus Omnitrophica bacterium]|nr:Glycine cleavage system H protein [Candidatus Omnitrophota bacterium]